MSEHRRSTLNEAKQDSKCRKYQLIIYDKGNVLTLKSDSPLLSSSRMESFDFPLRESSGKALGKTTDFGGNLVRCVTEKVSGATRISVQLYQAVIELGGIFDQEMVLVEMKLVLEKLCDDACIEPVIEVEIRKQQSKESGHPFGPLPLRLHAQRQRIRRK